MARGKKTGGKNFEPGNKVGKGRPPIPEDIKQARKLNQNEFERVANKFLYLTRDELKAALAQPTTTTIELMLGSIIAQAVQKGDHMRLEFMLNRLIGKVTDVVKLEVEPFVIERPYSGKGQEVLGVVEKTK